ncbi:MAG: FtsK/SpoIIIE domain-containing protein [Synergistaceae bacterium]|nr:FtsK/SpoIIIE domain-containing protein [Synergistaceae bacterium]
MRRKIHESKMKSKSKRVRGDWKELLFFILLMMQTWLLIILIFGPRFDMRGLWIENYLINVCGGAVIIPILFMIYVTMAKFFDTSIPHFIRQLFGTAVFYLTAALTLGLFQNTSWSNSIPRLLQAGAWGRDITILLIRDSGIILTMFAGLTGVFLASALYGIPLFSFVIKFPITWVFSKISKLVSNMKEKRQMVIEERTKQRKEAEKMAEIEKRKQLKQINAQRFSEKQKAVNIGPEETLSAGSVTREEEIMLFFEQGKFAENKTEIKEDEPSFDDMLKTSLATVKDIPVDARLQNKPKIQITPPNIEKDRFNIIEKTDSTESEKTSDESSVQPEHTLNGKSVPIIDSYSKENNTVISVKTIEPIKSPEEDIALIAGQEIPPDPELPEETDDYSAAVFPPPLEIYGAPMEELDSSEVEALVKSQGEKIIETLQNFSIKSSMAEIVIGPSIVQFQIDLSPGIRVSKVAGLANDLAMALAVVSVRVEAPIPGKPYVGIEIPNAKRRGIPLRSVIESQDYQESKNILPLPLGMRVDSRYMVTGLEEMPHLLVAGTTGSGKSIFMNTCIMGMCSKRTPSELNLILVDPKYVEFAIYEGLPHLLARPISEPKKAVSALAWAIQEMESRSQMFALAKVRNLESYNAKLLPKSKLPYIVIVVDELADLMYTSGKEVEALIARLAQKARSAGIHMILATQRPSVDVITGLIKANIPARVAFSVPSQTDSRTIIDSAGADKLLGKGDMLFLSTRYPRPVRLQASFIDEKRTISIIECLRQSFGQPEYMEFEDYKEGNKNGSLNNTYDSGVTLDPKIDEALNFIMESGIASASKLQTIMGIGYPRASRIISTLEQLGILGPQPSSPSKPREILMSSEEAFDKIRNL